MIPNAEPARPGGFEPPTYGLEIRCSIRLSYGRNFIGKMMLVKRFDIVLFTVLFYGWNDETIQTDQNVGKNAASTSCSP
jgi:hypothetical protein